ncbi:NAD(P)-dependent oxidoreductase [Myxococcota bacterium]|nr:NAD(P)-dependent oxidoreductase [Myxococcota bacterium]
MNVLLLGGSGFIGRHLRSALPAARAPARSDLDLADPAAVRASLRALRPDLVFNLAAAGVHPSDRAPSRLRAINEGLPRLLAEELAEGAVLVHAGSAAELGAGADADEGVACEGAAGPYGQSKRAGTRAVLEVAAARGQRAVVARLFSVYGPGEAPHRLLPQLQAAARETSRWPLPLTEGHQRRDLTYVGDVVQGLLALARAAPAGGTLVNLATGRNTPVRELVERAAALLGLPAGALAFGALPERPDEPAHGAVPVARLRALVGWAPPTGLEEGLRRTFEAAP